MRRGTSLPSYVIDRFEGEDWAILEDEHTASYRVPRRNLPPDAREGDVLVGLLGDGGSSSALTVDPAARQERLARAEQLRNQLPRGPKGDLSL